MSNKKPKIPDFPLFGMDSPTITGYRIYLSVRIEHTGEQVADITHSFHSDSSDAESLIEQLSSDTGPLVTGLDYWFDVKIALIDLFIHSHLLFVWMKEAITE